MTAPPEAGFVEFFTNTVEPILNQAGASVLAYFATENSANNFLVAPEQLLDSMAKVRSVMDQHSPAIDRATLARFITEGFFLSHVRRVRKIYSERRDFFVEQFNKSLGDRCILQVPKAGLNFVAWLKRKEDFPMVRRVTLEIGVKPSPLSNYCVQPMLKPAFVFGFAAWTPAQIGESLVKLASALR